jgi:hypothetical protein
MRNGRSGKYGSERVARIAESVIITKRIQRLCA